VGYPQGIPPTDYIPLLALLSRRLTKRRGRDGGHHRHAEMGGRAGPVPDSTPESRCFEAGLDILQLTFCSP
jgi:hypothetical protein